MRREQHADGAVVLGDAVAQSQPRAERPLQRHAHVLVVVAAVVVGRRDDARDARVRRVKVGGARGARSVRQLVGRARLGGGEREAALEPA
eukprot:2716650-Pleurochrysis_carterae.AAC.1